MKILHTIGTSLATIATMALALVPSTAGAVDGVVLITQARAIAGGVTAGDLPGFPVTISASGSYRLASDLQVASPGVAAIDITANNIELDLNGFTVFGPGKGAGSAAGIEGHPGGGTSGSSVTIKNGFVRNMGGHGIAIDSSTTVDHVVSAENGMDGMILTTGARITNSQANGNGRHGFRILIGQISRSHASKNGKSGAYVEYGSSLLSDNVFERNSEWGIYAAPGSGRHSAYKGNVLSDNASGNAGGTLVELGPNLCSSTTACP